MVNKKSDDYQGTMSRTKGGYRCQQWNLDGNPHTGLRGSYPHDYCRNPDKSDGPWCYTTLPSKRWDYCDVSSCKKCHTGRL